MEISNRTVTKTSSVKLPFRWDAVVSRYRDSKGRFISRGSIIDTELNKILEKSADEARALFDDLRASGNVKRFQLEMMRMVRSTQTMTAAIAKGGFKQLTARDLEALKERLGFHLGKLNNFASQVASGAVKLDGLQRERAAQYAYSARGTFWKFDQKLQRENGYDQERNRTTPARHCLECLDLESEGWVEIGTLPGIGERTCRTRCKCFIEYRNSQTGEELIYDL